LISKAAALARALAAQAAAVVQTTAFRRRALQKLSKNSSLIFRKNFLRSRLKSGLIGLKPGESQNHCHINQ
jgi:hypothetical protein